MAKLTSLAAQKQAKRERLKHQYGRNMQARIRRVEAEWGRCALAGCLDEVLAFDEVQALIKREAAEWARKTSYIRLDMADFMSEFYEAAWHVIDSYTWATDFYMYETLRLTFRSRALNLIKRSSRNKRKYDHTALPLLYADTIPAPDDVEQRVTDSVFVEEVFNDPTWTAFERDVLTARYDGESVASIALRLGRDRKTVRAALERVKAKLAAVA